MKKILPIIFLMMSSSIFADITFKDAIIKNNFGKKITAGFATISSDEDLKIIEITSNISKRIEVHSMIMDGDVMRMRKIESPIITKDKSLELQKLLQVF